MRRLSLCWRAERRAVEADFQTSVDPCLRCAGRQLRVEPAIGVSEVRPVRPWLDGVALDCFHMATATWNGAVLADTDDVVMVEGNVYFPIETVDPAMLEDSPLHTRCYWKGKASYYDVVVGDERLPSAAFHYPKPWPLAKMVTGRVAFWRGVDVSR